MDNSRIVRFATTRWSLVAAADARAAESATALEELCGAYWRPLYAFLRQSGQSPVESEDLVQGFLTDLLARGDVSRADPARGRFRTFLLASLKNYVSKQRDRRAASKRSGTWTRLNFADAERAFAAGRDDRTPQQAFDRQWALSLLEGVLDDLRQDQTAAGRAAWFERLSPLLTGEGAAPYATIARQLDATPGAVKQAASRLRREYRDRLERALASGLADPADLPDERRRLFEALG